MSSPTTTRTSVACRIKLVEVVLNERVAWQVLDNHFNFTTDKAE